MHLMLRRINPQGRLVLSIHNPTDCEFLLGGMLFQKLVGLCQRPADLPAVVQIRKRQSIIEKKHKMQYGEKVARAIKLGTLTVAQRGVFSFLVRILCRLKEQDSLTSSVCTSPHQ